MHLVLEVTAANTSEIISSLHEIPEAPIWPVEPIMQKRFVITRICWVSSCHTSNNTHHAKHNTPVSVESMGSLTRSELGIEGSALLNQILIDYMENQHKR